MTARGKNRLAGASRFGGWLLAILTVWFAALATVPVIRGEPGQYLVVGPSERRLEAIRGTDAQLIAAGPGYTQISASSPKLVAQLYARGAWLVLPAGNGGCLRLSDWRRPAGD